MRVWLSVSLVACAGMLTSACSDTTGFQSRSPTPVAFDVSGTHVTSHPNSQKYRDAGFHPAIGRSGSATIAVRALLDKSGNTDIEVTTGTFDEGPGPGTLASVQVKGYSPSGKLFLTRNLTDLAGSVATFSYDGFARGVPLQVQAVVRSSDGTRSDVVTVADTVRLRPDLVALRLEGPPQAPVGAAVNFTGFVAEDLGDFGARASCVLEVDGATVDRADGIWVDAGGLVACAMTHAFATPGTHALAFRVENVVPGDYSDENNAVSASIVIAEPQPFSTYSAQAWSTTEDTWWRAVSTLTLPDGTVETWDQTQTRQGTFQWAGISGLIPRTLTYPIAAAGELVTNGDTINALDLTLPTGDWVDWEQAYCASSSVAGVNAGVYTCVYTGGRLAGYTYVQYEWWGADARYHSDTYVTSWDPSGVLHERWISEDWTQVTPMVTFGLDFFARMSVQGAGEQWPATVQATVAMEPVTMEFDEWDPGCHTTPVSTSCWEVHSIVVGVTGYFDYGTWPPFTP